MHLVIKMLRAMDVSSDPKMTSYAIRSKSTVFRALLRESSREFRDSFRSALAIPRMDSGAFGPWNVGQGGDKGNRAVRRVPLPSTGSLSAHYDGAILAEAYAISLPERLPRDSFKTARHCFESLPLWFRTISHAFDRSSKEESTNGFRHTDVSSDIHRVVHIGGFHIYSYIPDEITLGWENSHLSFRIAVLLTPPKPGKEPEVIISAAAHCRDSIGKKYLKAVSPYFRYLLRSRLLRFASSERNLQKFPGDDSLDRLGGVLERSVRTVENFGALIAQSASAHNRLSCDACVAFTAKNGPRTSETFYPPYHDMYPPITKADYTVGLGSA